MSNIIVVDFNNLKNKVRKIEVAPKQSAKQKQSIPESHHACRMYFGSRLTSLIESSVT